ncbi:eCIS core domain-containing protein [Polyangium fumosum]|uniref:eCIS core domain-containing protein n=1 Tax=Polyangium fumosum TaxID=889272 RepID=UPI0014798381|nr:DUF4157 domain-containing protein [Polyangium fumosum]
MTPSPSSVAALEMQPRFMVRAAADRHEREADRVAENASHPAGPAPPVMTALTAGPEGADPSLPPALAARVSEVCGSGGAPLVAPLRAFYEPQLGHDLGDALIHTGGQAAALAEQLHAKAFTTGRHVVFSAGAFRPDSNEGQRLLAHELAHVAQQARSADAHRPLLQRQAAGPEPSSAIHRVLLIPDPAAGAARVMLKPNTGIAEITTPKRGNIKVGVNASTTDGKNLWIVISVTPGTSVRLNPRLPAGVTVNVVEIAPALPKLRLSPAEGASLRPSEAEAEPLGSELSVMEPLDEASLEQAPAVPPVSASTVSSPPLAPVAEPPAPVAEEEAPGPEPEAPANPYKALSLDEKVAKINELLDDWWTGRDILSVFQAATPSEFIELQRSVDMDRVLGKLDDPTGWNIVRFGALGPILAPQRQAVNEARAEFLVEITRSWGVERAQIFAHSMFVSMPGDDAEAVLGLLAAGQHLYQTINEMPEVAKLLDELGVDRSKFHDRSAEVMDVPRAIGRGTMNLLDSTRVAQESKGREAFRMGVELPEPYRGLVMAHDWQALQAQLTPGKLVFAGADYMTMGLLSMAKGVVYDLPTGVVSGVKELSKGHVAGGVEQLTGAAIFVLGAVLGIRAFRRFRRVAAMLELTPEGAQLYARLQTRIGKGGIDQVAKWIQASSEAQILVREHGALAIEALHAAKGDVEAARQALATGRLTPVVAPPAGAAPAPVKGKPLEANPQPQAAATRSNAEATAQSSSSIAAAEEASTAYMAEPVRKLLAREATAETRAAVDAFQERLRPNFERITKARRNPELLPPDQRAALAQAEADLDAMRAASSRTSKASPEAVARWQRAAEQVQRWADAGEPLTLDRIREINRILLAETEKQTMGGKLRTVDVATGGTNRYFPGAAVSQEMQDFLKWYEANRGKMNPVQLAALSYQRLVTIHPFIDGNGRTTRLVMDYILRSNGIPEGVFLHPEEMVAIFPRDAMLHPAKVLTPDAMTLRVMDAIERAVAKIPEAIRGPIKPKVQP